ncbi:MAG TPA: hypothetical protein VF765_03680 [Polyangiaceae bacterium]
MSSGARERGWLVVAHHHPGRLRVRSSRFELDGRLLETTQQWLVERPGVRDVIADATVGSILVSYEPSDTDAGELLLAIASRARLVVVDREPGEAAARGVFAATRVLDGLILDASGGRFGLGVVFPTALGLGSIASLLLSPHPFAPRWDNLLWWGMQAFRALNEDQRPPAGTNADRG